MLKGYKNEGGGEQSYIEKGGDRVRARVCCRDP